MPGTILDTAYKLSRYQVILFPFCRWENLNHRLCNMLKGTVLVMEELKLNPRSVWKFFLFFLTLCILLQNKAPRGVDSVLSFWFKKKMIKIIRVMRKKGIGAMLLWCCLSQAGKKLGIWNSLIHWFLLLLIPFPLYPSLHVEKDTNLKFRLIRQFLCGLLTFLSQLHLRC